MDSFANQKQWDDILRQVHQHKDDKVTQWRNELDTLIIVCGLSSIVVALFALESYRWLSEDPAKTTVILLTQISQQLNNQNTSMHSTDPSFRAPASVVLINCLWFLSLIITMGCTLIALLCKQWLHEHERHLHTRTRTPLEALALQRLRIESLDRWGVSNIITGLPVVLQLAFLLFFVGLMASTILSTLGFVTISFILLFYCVTSFLPTIQIVSHALRTSRLYDDSPAVTLFHLTSLQSICPYQTPQSWTIFMVVRAYFQNPFIKHILFRSSSRGRRSFGLFRDRLERTLRSVVNWSSLDLEMVRTFGELKHSPSLHEIKGLQWLVREFRDRVEFPHLKDILAESAPNLTSLVMSIAFDDWKLPLWKEFGLADVDRVLNSVDPVSFFSEERSKACLNPSETNRYVPSPYSLGYTQLLYYFSCWDNDKIDWRARYEITEKLYKMNIPRRARIPFMAPFRQLENLWRFSTQPTQLFEEGMPLEFLHFYELGWSIATESDSGHYDKLALVNAFVNHILTESEVPSVLFRSSYALKFVSGFLDKKIQEERLSENGHWIFAGIIPKWRVALHRMEEMHEHRQGPSHSLSIASSINIELSTPAYEQHDLTIHTSPLPDIGLSTPTYELSTPAYEQPSSGPLPTYEQSVSQ